jgi:hypothetical protein
MKREQISIAAHDRVSPSADCEFQEFVVLRIATGGDRLGDRDKFGASHDFRKPRPHMLRD